MRKKIITPFLAITLILSSGGVRADEQVTTETPTTSETPIQNTATTEEIDTNTPSSQEPHYVGAASTDAAQAAKKRQWQNIGIAALAVAVAATAIYLASTNGGHND